MNHSNGQKQNGSKTVMSRLVQAASAARQEAETTAHLDNYGKHAEMLGVGATWVDGNAFKEMTHVQS